MFLIVLCINTLFAAERADFLIIENPAALKIYDSYQQELSYSAKSERLAYAPLQIINENELLGDQITESIHVRLDNRNDFFIIKDNHGEMLNGTQAGSVHTFRKCLIVNDSIYVKKSGLLKLKTALSSMDLTTGNYLKRIFKYQNRYYMLQYSPVKQYGWLTLANNNFWEIIIKQRPKDAVTFLSMDLKIDILNVFNNVNKLYMEYFDFFNQKTRKNDVPPQWNVQITEESLQAEFLPDSLTGGFKSSISSTQRQLENVLIGTPYKLSIERNRLTISNSGK